VGDEALVVARAEATDRPRGLEPGEGAVIDGRAVVAASTGGVALLRGRRVREDDVEEAVETRQIAALLSATKMPASGDSR
jgi:hypothetical protein